MPARGTTQAGMEIPTDNDIVCEISEHIRLGLDIKADRLANEFLLRAPNRKAFHRRARALLALAFQEASRTDRKNED
jgi:hypothetical protein